MIRFRDIINENVADICSLQVFDYQKNFVASNLFSLAEAFACRNEDIFAMPFGIYDEDTLIGFVMIGYGATSDPEEPAIADGNYILWRLMVDKKYQGKGYVKIILDEIIRYIKTFPAGEADYVWLSYEKGNEHAKKIYNKYGFIENGELCGEEIVAVYSLK